MSLNFSFFTEEECIRIEKVIIERLKITDREVSVQTGNKAYTQSEWEKVLRSFDKAEESIQENVEERKAEIMGEEVVDDVENDNAPETYKIFLQKNYYKKYI
jgi:hypothetical protein